MNVRPQHHTQRGRDGVLSDPEVRILGFLAHDLVGLRRQGIHGVDGIFVERISVVDVYPEEVSGVDVGVENRRRRSQGGADDQLKCFW